MGRAPGARTNPTARRVKLRRSANGVTTQLIRALLRKDDFDLWQRFRRLLGWFDSRLAVVLWAFGKPREVEARAVSRSRTRAFDR